MGSIRLDGLLNVVAQYQLASKPLNILAVMSTSEKCSNKYDGKNNAGYGRIGGIKGPHGAGRRMDGQIRAMRDETRTAATAGRGAHG
ncbi:hypothetical protein [Paraburkholderia sp. GAS32]|uniref:hypothetical protein n=1 Tax=Paraburkholderia sp. GAS32 TaxID=3035129 RepID=UPI003D1EAB8D